MARIRSIKPEFTTDGGMLRLSDSCALFFVSLWCYCDDEGKHPLDYVQLAAELGGRWHVGKLKLFVSCLIKSGQLRINSTSTWIQVTGWSHQKIDKPKQPKVKALDLQWVGDAHSTIGRDDSRGVDARIGSDRRGEDRIHAHAHSQANEPEQFGLEQTPKPVGFDLEAVYREYPRKQGKARGLKKLAKEIKSADDLAGVWRALQAFKAHHERKRTEGDYLPYFDTWVSSWKDWLDPEHGRIESPASANKDWLTDFLKAEAER